MKDKVHCSEDNNVHILDREDRWFEREVKGGWGLGAVRLLMDLKIGSSITSLLLIGGYP